MHAERQTGHLEPVQMKVLLKGPSCPEDVVLLCSDQTKCGRITSKGKASVNTRAIHMQFFSRVCSQATKTKMIVQQVSMVGSELFLKLYPQGCSLVSIPLARFTIENSRKRGREALDNFR